MFIFPIGSMAFWILNKRNCSTVQILRK